MAAPAEITQSRTYEGEVLKSMGVKTDPNAKGNSFPYVAVRNKSEICNKCFLQNGELNEKEHRCKNTCYQTQCSKCGYFGHAKSNCKQVKHMDGNVLKST
jgi:hypothetical protein